MARDETGGLPLPGRLSLGALGLALVLVVGGAWVTGSFYLLARLGPGSPVALARLDGPHVYAGLVGGAFVAAKVARVGLRRRVAGVPGLLLWQRWISWSMLGLYAAVFASGIVLLLPISGDLYGDLTEVHLLTSIWAAALTMWHVWHYRARALPYVSRLGARAVRLRFWIGLGLLVPATLLLLVQPRAASQLPQVLGGSSWSRTGLAGTSLRTITTSPDGSTLIAGGDGGVFFSRDGVSWRRLSLPAAPPSGTRQSTVREVVSLAADRAGIYAGTTDGLYFASTARGPLRGIGLSGQTVWSVATDPADAHSLAAATSTGPMLSGDGGRTWRSVGAGLANPHLSTAMAYYGGSLFVSDLSGVFQLEPGAGAWRRVSGQTQVIWLAPGAGGRELYATSSDLRLEVLAQRRWSVLATPPLSRAHQHGDGGEAHAEPGSVVAQGSRLYVSGTGDGVSASADAGRTWTQLGVGMVEPAPAQVVAAGDALWAATGDGVYRYPLTPGTAPSATWWALVAAAGLGSGVLITAIALPEGRRDRRTRWLDR